METTDMKIKSLTSAFILLTLPTAFVAGQWFSPAPMAESSIERISAKEERVATYSTGTYRTQSYEVFDFSIEGEETPKIAYAYGKNVKEVELTLLGADTLNGARCFKVQFPNGLALNLIPTGLKLKVVDGKGKYSKIFEWEYEGPVNGIGTFCERCFSDDKEAMAFIKKYFIK